MFFTNNVSKIISYIVHHFLFEPRSLNRPTREHFSVNYTNKSGDQLKGRINITAQVNTRSEEELSPNNVKGVDSGACGWLRGEAITLKGGLYFHRRLRLSMESKVVARLALHPLCLTIPNVKNLLTSLHTVTEMTTSMKV